MKEIEYELHRKFVVRSGEQVTLHLDLAATVPGIDDEIQIEVNGFAQRWQEKLRHGGQESRIDEIMAVIEQLRGPGGKR